jgi:molecular chaperone GrpE
MSDQYFEEQQQPEMLEQPDGLKKLMEIASLKQSLAEARARAEENLSGWQRAQADFNNYKRRLEQDRDEAIKYSQAGLILKLLPVLDDFELAMKAIPQEQEKQPWVAGIKGIARKLLVILESQGISEIKAQGELFDPTLHEAVMQAPGIEGIVVHESQKGYRFQDKILRPSRVVVGNGNSPDMEVASY